jgi:chaperonin GroEL
MSELENPMFLLCDKKINNMDDIIPVMTLAKKTGRPLVVIAEDIDGQALSQLVVNKVHKSLLSVAIKAPGFSESRFENLTDIAVLTNSVVFSESTGFTLETLTDENISEEMFGGAEGITVERTSTVIVNGRGDDNVILDRVGQLTRKAEEADSEHEAKQLRSRIAKLSGGVAVVYVGASSPTEAKEKKDRADDALCAVRAAIEEGIVDGGGSALLRARSAITLLMGDENVGAQIIKEAIARPVKIISENAGKSGDVTLADVGALEEGWGYNAKLDRYAIMKDEGVIDPLKVTRVALESANSAAGMILLTECAIF